MNKFILSGNLTADPTFHAGAEESKHRCNFRIAHNHTKDRASFFSCTAWGKSAERASKLTKGKRVLVEGDIEDCEWTDQQGVKQHDKQVNVRNVEYIDFPEQQPTAPAPDPASAPVTYAPPPGFTPPPAYGQQPVYGAPPAARPPVAAPPVAAPPVAPPPQYHTDAAGNVFQLINNQWVLVKAGEIPF